MRNAEGHSGRANMITIESIDSGITFEQVKEAHDLLRQYCRERAYCEGCWMEKDCGGTTWLPSEWKEIEEST